MPLGTEIGLGPDNFVFDGHPAPFPILPSEKELSPRPNFWPMSTVAKRLDGSRFKMPLGTEVNRGPGDVVLDGVAAPP